MPILQPRALVVSRSFLEKTDPRNMRKCAFLWRKAVLCLLTQNLRCLPGKNCTMHWPSCVSSTDRGWRTLRLHLQTTVSAFTSETARKTASPSRCPTMATMWAVRCRFTNQPLNFPKSTRPKATTSASRAQITRRWYMSTTAASAPTRAFLRRLSLTFPRWQGWVATV